MRPAARVFSHWWCANLPGLNKHGCGRYRGASQDCPKCGNENTVACWKDAAVSAVKR